MIIEILKAFLVGIILAVPVGPVLFFVIQKTMCDSRRAGLYSGLGSAFADTVYATIGVFALGLVWEFIEKNSAMIMLVGGVLVLLVGANMLRSKITDPLDGPSFHQDKPWFWYSSQTALCAFSNPSALVVAMGVLALFKLDSATLSCPVWAVIPCVFVGELSYWTFVTFVLDRFLHPSPRIIGIINRVAAVIVMGLGVFLAVKGLITLLK